MARCTCPIFTPSIEEFRDFQSYIATIEPQCMPSHGLAKIIPPAGWWRGTVAASEVCDPQNAAFDRLGQLRLPRPIRQAVSGNRGVYSVVHMEQHAMAVRAFADHAQRHCKPDVAERADGKRLRGVAGTEAERLERRFWQSLSTGAGDERGAALYGADVASISVFELLNAELAAEASEAPEWHLDTFSGDLLRRLGVPMAGITLPMVYLGAWRAMFAWHCEDMNLYSINVLLAGAPKSWYGVGVDECYKFEDYAAKLYPDQARECPEFLRHKMSMIDPSLLRAQGMHVCECVQEAGEIMVTFPRCYHAGFNHGWNVAESTNFATHRWSDHGKLAGVCKCEPGCAQFDVEHAARLIDAPAGEMQMAPPPARLPTARVPKKASRRTSAPVELLLESPGADALEPSPAAKNARRSEKGSADKADKASRRARCGDCAGCNAPACLECKFCVDRTSGANRLRKPCVLRRCLHIKAKLGDDGAETKKPKKAASPRDADEDDVYEPDLTLSYPEPLPRRASARGPPPLDPPPPLPEGMSWEPQWSEESAEVPL
ncbi:JmjC domain, hydroxylase-domain-containing protein, partial [Pelagophyceae sp. CCMP2097]